MYAYHYINNYQTITEYTAQESWPSLHICVTTNPTLYNTDHAISGFGRETHLCVYNNYCIQQREQKKYSYQNDRLVYCSRPSSPCFVPNNNITKPAAWVISFDKFKHVLFHCQYNNYSPLFRRPEHTKHKRNITFLNISILIDRN